jgi:hypothetical protein
MVVANLQQRAFSALKVKPPRTEPDELSALKVPDGRVQMKDEAREGQDDSPLSVGQRPPCVKACRRNCSGATSGWLASVQFR